MDGLDLLGTLLKVVVVFGLLFVTLKVLARYQGGRGGRLPSASRRPQAGASVVELVEQVRVGRSASVVAVRLGDRHVALAITDTSVTPLGEVEVDLPEQPIGPITAPPGLLNAALDALRDKTTRR